MTRQIRVGLVCGCLGAPMESVGKSDLFHQVAAGLLADAGISLRVSLRSIDDFRLERMLDHLQFLVTERSCDVLVFQIRPSLLRQAAVVVWKTNTGRGPARVRVSPYYTHDLNSWAPPSTLAPLERFHGVNYSLARLTGLQHRARMQVTFQLEAIAHAARERLHTPLLFLGPVFNNTLPPPLDEYWTPLLRTIAEQARVPLVDLCDFRVAGRQDLFEPEGFHVNRRGHSIIGQRFAAALSGHHALQG